MTVHGHVAVDEHMALYEHVAVHEHVVYLLVKLVELYVLFIFFFYTYSFKVPLTKYMGVETDIVNNLITL